jgi:hypothetical protein
MKYIQAMLAVVGLLIVGGVIDAARGHDHVGEDEGVTLYTPLDGGDRRICSAVNVSDKTLGMIFAVLGLDGHALSCDSPITCRDASVTDTSNPTPEFAVLAGTAAAIAITRPLGSATDGYCQVTVSGTGNRDDVRVNLLTTSTRTIPGTTTPVFVFKVLEGH